MLDKFSKPDLARNFMGSSSYSKTWEIYTQRLEVINKIYSYFEKLGPEHKLAIALMQVVPSQATWLCRR